ncbi:S8 family serine peptidase [Pseudoalteromonas sp. JBTF-M23]|uniref:S8 family serine peptidase n=1 Tax=Pseudoalteromonas caenipelagi TaxID=2726988 RepID=A0A849V954_9GAMM|nr:S8 family serine peptidase [Pseudoalteromonas caenipelagi]NOU49300.1 S8 family serine peptidase [Pseudoalteromonas caenipelagi]
MKKVTTNKAIFATTLLSLAVSASLQASPLKQVAEKSESPLPKRYIVKYKDNEMAMMGVAMQDSANMPQMAANRMATLGVQNAQFKASLNAVVAQLSDTQLMALRNDNLVEYVEEDLPRRLMSQTQPYGISMVQADLVDDSVASAANGGKKICVIDSGLDLPHEDMGARGDTISGTNDSGTGNWYEHGGPHGTHVAGTIAALNNGIGVRGVIGTDPSMHIIKVFNADGWGYSSELVDAINKCKAAGSDVVNMSLGGEGSSVTERNGIQAAADAGMLLIAAAGNDGVPTNTTDVESYPASYDSVMSVAAIDSNKELADFSQKNSQVEIAAPGVDVNSSYPEGLGTIVSLSVAGQSYDANGMENQGNANAPLYNFATGESVDSGANGKVCLIQRGNISFHDKVKNCEDSGGVGAIIYNNAAGSFGGTLGDTNATSIPAVTVSDTAGADMLNNIGMTASVNLDPSNYGLMSGTSMASPHVAGVAALVWSHHPSCTASQIRAVLTATAQDLGATGRDVKFGYGLVQTKDAIDFITEKGCDGTGGPVEPPVSNELENGVAKSNLSGAKAEELLFTFEVPAGATDVKVNMSGGTGDADLYVQFGSKPSDSNFECRPYAGGNNESCNLTKSGGTYQVMVKGYSAFSGVSLVASYTDGGTTNPGTQPIDVTETGISVARRGWTRFTLDLADGYSDLNVTTSGGTGDADLFVTRGAQSTTSSYDCKSESSSNNESCAMQNPQAGTWYIDIYGYRASSGITLNVAATPK